MKPSSALIPLLLTAATVTAAPTLDESRALLEKAAKTADPVQARTLALQSLEGLVAADKPGVLDCWLIAAITEAQIRAGIPAAALETIGRRVQPACDLAAFASLSAWAHEYAPDGTRRGPGSPLKDALSLYLKAADLYEGRAGFGDPMAAALASAADIALLLGQDAVAQGAAARALRAKPSRDIAVTNGLLLLRAAGPVVGEGAATDLLDDATGGDVEVMRDVLERHVVDVNRLHDADPDDARLMTAKAFYALFTGGNVAAPTALALLDKASAQKIPVPELHYLRGRAASLTGDHAKAHDAWRAQVREAPDAPASRLAANDLAHSLATHGGLQADLQAALATLDRYLAQTPSEAAMHETRGLLLERMGRMDEALASMRKAQSLERTPERDEAVRRLGAR